MRFFILFTLNRNTHSLLILLFLRLHLHCKVSQHTFQSLFHGNELHGLTVIALLVCQLTCWDSWSQAANQEIQLCNFKVPSQYQEIMLNCVIWKHHPWFLIVYINTALYSTDVCWKQAAWGEMFHCSVRRMKITLLSVKALSRLKAG